MADDLRATGATVHLTDEAGQQFAVSTHGGHFSGHMDGAAIGILEAPETWHVVEFKTHNAKSFKGLKDKGVAQANPEHWAQMQVYMRLAGMDRAIYLAVNKDTDELHAERVELDKNVADQILARAYRIITTNEPQPKIAEDPEAFACKFCSHHTLCHATNPSAPAVPAPVSCRNCCHATPLMEGNAAWRCELHARGLSENDQAKACPDHLFIPALLSFAVVIDAGDTWIEYEKKDNGARFRCSRSANDYTSAELAELPAALVGNGAVDAVKTEIGAVVTEAA